MRHSHGLRFSTRSNQSSIEKIQKFLREIPIFSKGIHGLNNFISFRSLRLPVTQLNFSWREYGKDCKNIDCSMDKSSFCCFSFENSQSS